MTNPYKSHWNSPSSSLSSQLLSCDLKALSRRTMRKFSRPSVSTSEWSPIVKSTPQVITTPTKAGRKSVCAFVIQ